MLHQKPGLCEKENSSHNSKMRWKTMGEIKICKWPCIKETKRVDHLQMFDRSRFPLRSTSFLRINEIICIPILLRRRLLSYIHTRLPQWHVLHYVKYRIYNILQFSLHETHDVLIAYFHKN